MDAFSAGTLVTVLEIIEANDLVQVVLDVFDGLVLFLASLDLEVLIETRAIHALDKASGSP